MGNCGTNEDEGGAVILSDGAPEEILGPRHGAGSRALPAVRFHTAFGALASGFGGAVLAIEGNLRRQPGSTRHLERLRGQG
jgi:hypothetical protein